MLGEYFDIKSQVAVHKITVGPGWACSNTFWSIVVTSMGNNGSYPEKHKGSSLPFALR